MKAKLGKKFWFTLDLDKAGNWTMIFLIIGLAVIVIGMLGFFMIDEPKGLF